jgi:enamine deaminase RidA (YjgF/YER057c/UK114 family)
MPKVIKPAAWGPPQAMYSYGMAATGEVIAIAGMTGIDAHGKIAGPDVESQTRQVFENIRTVVEAAGCTMRDVVRLQTFLTRADDVAGFQKARGEMFARYFPDRAYPPNTLLVITRLAHPDLVVEIEALAVRPSRPAPAKGAKRPTRARRARSR